MIRFANLKESMIDINKTLVTSDHHFREWTHFGGLLCESSKEQEEENWTYENRSDRAKE